MLGLTKVGTWVIISSPNKFDYDKSSHLNTIKQSDLKCSKTNAVKQNSVKYLNSKHIEQGFSKISKLIKNCNNYQPETINKSECSMLMDYVTKLSLVKFHQLDDAYTMHKYIYLMIFCLYMSSAKISAKFL